MRGLLCFLLLFALTVNMNARPQADTRINNTEARQCHIDKGDE